MNDHKKSYSALTERQRGDLIALLRARVRNYAHITVPVKTLKSHPFYSVADPKSKHYWLYGSFPISRVGIERFFLTIDRAIVAAEENNDYPVVANMIFWRLKAIANTPMALQVYLTHERVQGMSKRGSFYFIGAFYEVPKDYNGVYAYTRSLANAYAAEWRINIREMETAKILEQIDALNLDSWCTTSEVVANLQGTSDA